MVESILTNEKYKGDALLQKVYTTDFLSKKKKKNEGEVPQYYVEGNHEAIIPPAVFDNVQLPCFKCRVFDFTKACKNDVFLFPYAVQRLYEKLLTMCGSPSKTG